MLQRRIVHTLFLLSQRNLRLVLKQPASVNIHVSRYSQDVKQPVWMPEGNHEDPETDFAKFDSEEFGALSGMKPDINDELDVMPEELEDKEEYDIVDESGKKVRRKPVFYHILIKKLLAQKKVADAIAVLEDRIIKKEHSQGDYYTWNLLINGCAKAGYCQKAFSLYQAMKARGIRRTAATYTGLFNACALSPFPEEALSRLNHLRHTLSEKGIELNVISYNALIKAYARLKDVHAAFLVVDEMLTKNFTLLPDTFSFLLQACISDKENGMRHALLTWHKMRAKKVTPTLYIYNLLIRCIRDCEFGDEEEVKSVIRLIITSESKERVLIDDAASELSAFSSETSGGNLSDAQAVTNTSGSLMSEEISIEELDNMENKPNLLAKRPYLGSIISIRMAIEPSDRLLLLGGFKTLLQEMKNDGVKPDIKTFTQLLDIMPSTISAEKYLLKELEADEVPIDIDFCNMLIKKRALRKDYEAAKEVLLMIQKNYLFPDIVTFGVFALCCRNQYEAEQLIHDMQEFNYRLNVEIIGGMLKNATKTFNFKYTEYLMRLLKRMRIKPSEQFMGMLDYLVKKSIDLRKRAKKKDPTVPSFAKKLSFHDDSLIFQDFWDQWKKQVDVFVPPHPYEQFRQLSGDAATEIDKHDVRIYSQKNIWTKDKLTPKYPPSHKKFGESSETRMTFENEKSTDRGNLNEKYSRHNGENLRYSHTFNKNIKFKSKDSKMNADQDFHSGNDKRSAPDSRARSGSSIFNKAERENKNDSLWKQIKWRKPDKIDAEIAQSQAEMLTTKD